MRVEDSKLVFVSSDIHTGRRSYRTRGESFTAREFCRVHMSSFREGVQVITCMAKRIRLLRGIGDSVLHERLTGLLVSYEEDGN